MRTVKWLLHSKPQAIWSVTPETTAAEAMRTMAEHDVGALLVFDGEGHLVGIVSERDFARELFLNGRPHGETRVGEVMTRRVLYVRPEHTVEECMALMTEMRLRHLPVLDGEQVVGMVSMRDLVQDVVADQQFMIDQLTNYITDRYA